MKKRLLLLVPALLGLAYLYFLPPVRRCHTRRPYALLLGCPCREDGSLSTSQKKRIQLAMDTQDKYDTLLICGGAVKNDFVESQVLKDAIQPHLDRPILCETESATTWQNLQNARDMIGDVPILLLTSGTHARRASAMARQFFSSVDVAWAPEHRIKHILQEAAAQAVYIKFELKKRIPFFR